MPFTSPVGGGNVITDWCIYTVCVCVRARMYTYKVALEIFPSLSIPQVHYSS